MNEPIRFRNNNENHKIPTIINFREKNHNILYSPGFHTKKNSQISSTFRNLFDKNFNLNNLNKSSAKFNTKLNSNKIKYTKNFISPTILETKYISNSNFDHKKMID